jgi:hypothetical protein
MPRRKGEAGRGSRRRRTGWWQKQTRWPRKGGGPSLSGEQDNSRPSKPVNEKNVSDKEK